MNRMRDAGMGLLVLGGALLFAAPVAAQHRTGVILEFEGRGGGVARNAVVSALSDQMELVPQADFEDRARSLGADLDDPEGMALVAQDMGVDVIVKGEMRGRGRRIRTTILIFDAQGNEVVSQRAGSPAGRRGRRRVARAARRAYREALPDIERAAAAVEAAPEPEPEEPPPGMGGGLDEELFGDEVDEEEDDEEEDESSDGAGVPFVEVMVGFGLRTRNAEINLESGGVRGYQTEPAFPELSLRLELRPFASDEGALRNVFAQAELFHSVGLGSRDMDTGEELSSTALRFLAQIGYLHGVTEDAHIGAALGLGYDAFSLDENETMASTAYTYVRPAVLGRAEVSGEMLQLGLDLGLRFTLGTGELAPMFGQEASAFAFDAGVALFGNLEGGFAYALRAGYVTYSLGFEGEAVDPANTAADGNDSYFYLTPSIGYRF